ncbi:hypothetical protein ACTHAM_000529 [Cellulomonas soli]|uniref:hypothetical protein n=1 Tax=Cellulomonas soli TaxID=931535 RepID=UPI003F876932
MSAALGVALSTSFTVLGAAVHSATPSPSPSDVVVTGSSAGSPGFLGFVFTFALAVACVGLFLSLTKQLRVVDRRAKQREEDERDAPQGGAAPEGEVEQDASGTVAGESSR